ncbi:MAG: Hsp33 family molecular chaperone HslO [Acutalibacteraceae bacterium]|nr:Hsp33 family molecular chaperone HslO [Acutalibacteraceae bacterium]
MGKLIRCITSEGAVMVSAVDSTDIVAKAEQIHGTSAVITAALGRMLTAASMMGNMLKGEKSSISLKIDGGGPAGAITVSADSTGNVRGYAVNPVVEIPLKPNGKLDVSGAVGTDGNLYIVKDLGMKEPYNGFVPIVSGEIAEDITSYYATSEQIPTVCALGVLVNPDLSVKKAGGYILQLLPFTEDEIITKIENNLKRVKPVTALLDEGWDIEEIVKDVLQGFEVEVIYSQEVEYKCKCEREKVEQTLQGLGEKELQEMIAEMPTVEVKCHFCNTAYSFTKNDIEKILKKIEKS